MMEREHINISLIRRDGGTQPRAELDLPTVAQYAEALEDEYDLPPVTVFYDGEQYWLADGFHRCRAHELAGVAVIDAEIIQGTQRDAILYSCSANATHGLRRTPADKRRQVMKLLTDPEWSTWSDREIARRCQVGNRFVGDLRRELCPDTVGGKRTYERDGKTLTMDTSGIGKRDGGEGAGGDERQHEKPPRQATFDAYAATVHVGDLVLYSPWPSIAPKNSPTVGRVVAIAADGCMELRVWTPDDGLTEGDARTVVSVPGDLVCRVDCAAGATTVSGDVSAPGEDLAGEPPEPPAEESAGEAPARYEYAADERLLTPGQIVMLRNVEGRIRDVMTELLEVQDADVVTGWYRQLRNVAADIQDAANAAEAKSAANELLSPADWRNAAKINAELDVSLLVMDPDGRRIYAVDCESCELLVEFDGQTKAETEREWKALLDVDGVDLAHMGFLPGFVKCRKRRTTGDSWGIFAVGQEPPAAAGWTYLVENGEQCRYGSEAAMDDAWMRLVVEHPHRLEDM